MANISINTTLKNIINNSNLNKSDREELTKLIDNSDSIFNLMVLELVSNNPDCLPELLKVIKKKQRVLKSKDNNDWQKILEQELLVIKNIGKN